MQEGTFGIKNAHIIKIDLRSLIRNEQNKQK
jgi:hypothetical protein